MINPGKDSNGILGPHTPSDLHARWEWSHEVEMVIQGDFSGCSVGDPI